ncbi:MAG: glycerol-3-phosphate 1-O-acyltransferase PlsY [Rhodobacteraceae bacterium]|nr:glycerol-3-phosphate 1-O-acyltransferase PlsY [Paracoccaceae bacterium]
MPDITTAPMLLVLAALAAYLLGSVPFGLVIARLFGLGDIRNIGSGNIGATNVLRTGNRFAAFLTLILDAGKGGIAVFIARMTLGEDAAQLAGFMAFLGHCYPVFLGFKGGKGVATWLGTLLVLAWPLGLAACATWLVVVAATRISSLGGLVSAALSPLWAWLFGLPATLALLGALALLIFLRHRHNITRLIAGTEPRVGKK